MSANTKTSYGPLVGITPGALSSLTDDHWWKSSAIDNLVARYLDAELEFQFSLGAGTLNPEGEALINVFLYGGLASPLNIYSSNIDGGEGLWTPEVIVQLPKAAFREVTSIGPGGVVTGFVPSLAAAMNGILPVNWGLVIQNATGVSLTAAALNWKGLYAISE